MRRVAPLGLLGLLALAVTIVFAPSALAKKRPPPVVGRWNLRITAPDGSLYPSWLDLEADDDANLTGRFCGRTGRAMPLAKIDWKKNELTFVETEAPNIERIYKAKIRFGVLEGTVSTPGTPELNFLAERAPKLHDRHNITWGKPLPLVTKGLLGWRLRTSKQGACWKENTGVLTNRSPCVDIISDGRYQDFKMHLEYKLEPGTQSGVYMRGRYEIRLVDDAGKPPTDEGTGAIFGLTVPNKNAAKPAGTWQALDVIMAGRRVTVMIDGDKVLDNQEVAGPTGGALDSDEAIPGPIMVQGDRGMLAVRNASITPATW